MLQPAACSRHACTSGSHAAFSRHASTRKTDGHAVPKENADEVQDEKSNQPRLRLRPWATSSTRGESRTYQTHLESSERRPDLFRQTNPKQRDGRGCRACAPQPEEGLHGQKDGKHSRHDHHLPHSVKRRSFLRIDTCCEPSDQNMFLVNVGPPT